MPIKLRLSAAALAALAVAPAFAAPAKDDGAPENPAACYVAVTPAANEPKPRIERGPASPDSAAGWYAVDRREGGCRKLVKMGNPSVSLPEPPREEGAVMPMRAR